MARWFRWSRPRFPEVGVRQGEAALPSRQDNPAWARILPFAAYIVFLILGHLLKEVFPAADLRWLYALQIGTVLGLMALYARSYVELLERAAVPARAWWQACGLGALAFVIWINVDLRGPGGDSFDATAADGTLDGMLAAVRLLGAVVVVPVMEELFWRSFVLRWIASRDFLAQAPSAAGWRALVVSSVLFGVEHETWLAGIFAGLIYGGLYMRSANLWLPIAAHATTNLLLGVWVLLTANWHYW